MAADRQRLAAALAYRQAEEERRRRMMESVPGLVTTPAQPAPRADFRTNLENLSIGLGRGVTTGLEGVKGIVTDPVGTAKGVYEAGRAVIRDPSVIADALRYTAQKATSGPLGAGEVIGEMLGPRKGGPVMQELDVYHGTPHRFPATEANPLGEFDASKIGTGEGAQVFGHGIYMAEKPAVAQDYQFMLSKIDPSKATYQGKPVEKWYEMAQAEQDRAHRLRDQKAIDRANAKLAFWENVMTRRHPEDAKRVANDPDDGWPELANYANSLDMNKFGGISEAGSLYKADLPDEMVGRMLDWHKPLSEQPKAVREALKKSGLTSYVDEMEQSYFSQLSPAARALAQKMINGPDEMIVVSGKGLKNNKVAEKNWNELERLAPGIDHNRVHDIRDWYQSKSGADLYSEMSRNGVQDASERLRQMGIPGISYLDAGSRGATGAQTRNFVVFPGEEKKVRILERDGQKAPPQKIAQALEAAPRKPETAFNAPEVKPGDIVDGLKVRPEVANVGSIKASLDNYTVLPGIRSVSIADFGEAGPLTGNVEKLDRRTRNLADQITESKEITPLIVVYSGTQNYILEGSHRIDALDALGKKRIPVIAVIDEDDPPKFMRQKR